MKEGSRLAQSLYQQVIEKVVIFYPFSRSPKVDFGGFEKRDSGARSVPLTTGFLTVVAAGKWQAAADLLEKAVRQAVVVVRPP